MRSVPLRVKTYILLIIVISGIMAGYSVMNFQQTYQRQGGWNALLEILLFSLAIFVADLYPIDLPTYGSEVTVSCAFKTAVAIIAGPHVSIIVTLLGTLAAEFRLRRTWYKALFNAGEMTITSASMSVVYYLLYDGQSVVPFASWQNAFAVIAVIGTYVLVNTGLVTIVVSLSTGASFMHVWKANFSDSAWNNLTIIPLGAVIAVLWLITPWSVLALILPLVVVRRSFHFIGELQQKTRETLIRMADAIDRRDGSTYQHSQRVADVSEAIAQEMDLPAEDVETIRMAARLHDIGKIGMSNTLLFKPGGFTDEEYEEFKRHSAIGAELVQSFRLFSEGQSLILYHHERWDGRGYPAGLSGTDIPLGARILAVADSFDAMTSRRVYREPMSLDDATKEVLNNRGTQFDPDVADAFLRILEEHDQRVIAPFSPAPVGEQTS